MLPERFLGRKTLSQTFPQLISECSALKNFGLLLAVASSLEIAVAGALLEACQSAKEGWKNRFD